MDSVAGMRSAIESWRYHVTWLSLPESAPDQSSGEWLLVVPPDGIAEPLATHVAAAMACRGTLEVDGRTADRHALARQLADLARHCPGPIRVVSLLGLDERPCEDHPVVTCGLAGTLTLYQALGDESLGWRLWCLTRGAVAVTDDDTLPAPAQAQLWGLGRVAALECPDRWGGLIDVGEAWDEAMGNWLRASLHAHGRGDTEDQIALRASGGYARRIARAAAAESTGSWPARGTTLITGGTGGLGAEVARWAAARGIRHLLLTSRSGAAAPGAAELTAELRAAGADPVIAACDTANRDALTTLLRTIPAERPLTAVVHAAGVDVASPLTEAGVSHLAAAFTAKVGGGALLHDLTADLPVEAFVVFTSIAGVWGSGGGLGAYAAANAYLDALAAHRRRRGQAGLAIAWGPWTVGMSVANAAHTAALARVGLAPMASRDAIAALDLCLADASPVVAVADVDWERFALAFGFARPAPLLSALADPAQAAG